MYSGGDPAADIALWCYWGFAVAQGLKSLDVAAGSSLPQVTIPADR